jgi:hypothetical protein
VASWHAHTLQGAAAPILTEYSAIKKTSSAKRRGASAAALLLNQPILEFFKKQVGGPVDKPTVTDIAKPRSRW